MGEIDNSLYDQLLNASFNIIHTSSVPNAKILHCQQVMLHTQANTISTSYTTHCLWKLEYKLADSLNGQQKALHVNIFFSNCIDKNIVHVLSIHIVPYDE